MGIKHCPKCGSTNINPLAFYRPSIWKCSDCGYEGAFILEDCPVENLQTRYCFVDCLDEVFHTYDGDRSTDNRRKL